MRKPPPFFVPRRGYHHGTLKESLLEAARHLITERGTAGFSLAEAAKLVGVTGAAPYRHFSDRNDLVGELARRGFELFALRLGDAFADGRPDAVSAFGRMGGAYLDFARDEPGLYRAMFADATALDQPGPGAAADRALTILRQGAEAVLAYSGHADADPRPLAFQIWALAHGVASLMLSGHLMAEGSDTPRRVLLDSVRALVMALPEKRN